MREVVQKLCGRQRDNENEVARRLAGRFPVSDGVEGGVGRGRAATGATLAAFGFGAVMAVQARVNAELGTRLGNSMQAALISFAVGLLVLCLISVGNPTMRAGIRSILVQVRVGGLPRWYLLGGLAGAAFVTAQAATVPLLGVALFTIIGIAVELATGLVLDRTRLGIGQVRPVSTRRMVAAIIAVIAVTIAGAGGLGAVAVTILAVLAAGAAKAGVTVQLIINARMARAAGTALSAALVSFAGGTTVLIVVCGGATLLQIAEMSWQVQAWWVYSGGVLGVLAFLIGTLVVPRVGVFVFSICAVAGQMIGAVVLDLVVPAGDTRLTLLTVCASLVMLGAVALATAPR